ncbi:integral membrane protein [Trichophyton violaceum]|uniref:Integral membrane protein n=1 Tax=Trichophyton violaceum TaxID=34388 RepID=A0A178FGT2_TRIVO|nr:integral membrane protein [Trichophyton violaceum]
MQQWVYYVSPEVNAISQYPTILAVCISLTFVMTVVVCLRIWVRAVWKKSFGVDDAVIVSSAVCGIIYSALCITQSRLGLGLPLKLRPKASLNTYATVNFAGRPFYMAGITGFKVALCIAYLRIIRHSSEKSYRHVVWGIMIFTILSHVAGTLVLFFQCSPVHKSWRPLTPGKCLPNPAVFYPLAGVSIFCDLIVLLTPIPLWLKVRISTPRKLGLMAVFLLGLFTTACSIMRVVQIEIIAKDGNSTMLILWGTIELNVGIAITCLPTLIPLITFMRGRSSKSGPMQYPHSTSDGRSAGTSVKLKSVGLHSSTMRSQTIPTGNNTLVKSGSFSSLEAILPVDSQGRPIQREDMESCNGNGSQSHVHLSNPGHITKTVQVEITRTDNRPGPEQSWLH